MERRRREGKTDYKSRLAALRSGVPRLVIRKSGHYIKADIVEFGERGDRILHSCVSKELDKYGWKGGKKNVSAAYLTGLLLSKKSGSMDVMLDIGRQTSSKGGKVYAAAKGALDGGLKLRLGDIAPSDDRIKGLHIASYAKMLNEGERQKRFSGYLKAGADPRNLEKLFVAVKAKIEGGTNG